MSNKYSKYGAIPYVSYEIKSVFPTYMCHIKGLSLNTIIASDFQTLLMNMNHIYIGNEVLLLVDCQTNSKYYTLDLLTHNIIAIVSI